MLNNKLYAALFFFGVGGCSLLAGLGFFWVSGQRNVLTCTRLERTHVDCRIERAFLGLIPSDELVITRVTGTEIVTECDDGCTHAVHLLSDEQAVPLSDLAISDLDSVEADQERIDEFLNDPEIKSLDLSSGPAWVGMLFSLPFVLLGAGVIGWGIRVFIQKYFSQ